MNKVHGVFKSFSDMGAALGVKAPVQKDKVHKCSNCGAPLRKCGDSNVYACDFYKMEDAKLNDVDVQVFSKCGNIVIDKA